jgi:hypothetical protein
MATSDRAFAKLSTSCEAVQMSRGTGEGPSRCTMPRTRITGLPPRSAGQSSTCCARAPILGVQDTGRGGTGAPRARDEQRRIVAMLLAAGGSVIDRDARGRTVVDASSQGAITAL